MTSRSLQGEDGRRLMKRAGRGDRRAFDEIVTRYHDRILGWVYRMTGDRESARDIAQETFLRLLQRASSYEDRGKLSTYLFVVSRRLAIDEIRRRRPHAGELPEELPATALDPAMEFEQGERARELESAVLRLPVDEREVLLLSSVAGLRYREIAEVVGCPAGTVASRKNRAIRMLQDELKERWQ